MDDETLTQKQRAHTRMKKRQWVLMVADHCQGLAEGWVEPELRDGGLCWEISHFLIGFANAGAASEHLPDVFRQWPRYSGDASYPVPHPKMTPDDAFEWGPRDLWDDSTEYGQNRLDLCEWVADWLRENVEELAR